MPLSNQEKGDRIARRVWSWLQKQKHQVSPPWDPAAESAESRGYAECLEDLRQLIEDEVEEVDAIARLEAARAQPGFSVGSGQVLSATGSGKLQLGIGSPPRAG